MSRLLYDSTTASSIPEYAEVVAGYVDGAYLWSDEDWARFPTAVKVGISTSARFNGGTVLDVEWGDATPADAPSWIRMRQQGGVAQPTVYCSRATMDEVSSLCAGLLHWLWVADWTGSAHPVPGAAAVQFANAAMSGGHYDLSAVYEDAWPGVYQNSKGDPPGKGVMDLPTAQLHVWEWYANFCGRVGTQAEVDYWAVQLAAPGANLEGVVSAFYATPEPLAWRERKG